MDTRMGRYYAKFEVMTEFAKSIATLSKCKRLQVGAVIVDHGLRDILSFGYNGPACSRHNDSCTNDTGSCGCVHAEMNALLKLSDKITPCYLITTHSPCVLCAGMILNTHNITDVLYVDEYRVNNTMTFHKIGEHYAIIKRRKALYDASRSATLGWSEETLS